MSQTIKFNDSQGRDVSSAAVRLELEIHDPEILDELRQHPVEQRDRVARTALRIGVLALRQARGQVDVDALRRENDRLLTALQQHLQRHASQVTTTLSGTLRDYFDPRNGSFHERVERLVRRDGELELLMRRQVGSQDSELCKTLTEHFGQQSPLMQVLDPDHSKSVLTAMRSTLEAQLKTQREHVLKQFSLDEETSALSRLVKELSKHQGEVSAQLADKIDDVVKEFSLDEEESALSRLVRNVERAQRLITNEFSLDDDGSALARLKREMTSLLKEQKESNQSFQEEVKGALKALAARRDEAKKSTRHGVEFEDVVFEFVQFECQKAGDIATHTGATTGRIKHCKKGDVVVELGPESAAPGTLIVVEAKQKTGYQLAKARDELAEARKNREGLVGLFVFSAATAPAGIEPLARYGQDVFVVWDADDGRSDIFFRAGITLARALCVRNRQQPHRDRLDFSQIDKAILEIERQVESVADMEKLTDTIRSHTDKVAKRLGTFRTSLDKQVYILREAMVQVRDLCASDATEPLA